MTGTHEAKAALRSELLAARRARSAHDLEAARRAIRTQVLARATGVGTVAAYVPLRTEPGSLELLTELAESGATVLVPVTRPDRDLDWTSWQPAGVGPPLGGGAVRQAGLVLVPALAVAADGTRLGRGGGWYDRALARCVPGTPTAALIFADEVVAELPRDAWDVPVTAAVTPDGWLDLGRNTDPGLAR
jgi:5-formyltetrahydrofolate cyclo-ligase